MLYSMLCRARTTGPAGRRRWKFIHCKQTPHSEASQKIQECSCRVEGFDPGSYPRQHKELKDLIQLVIPGSTRSSPWSSSAFLNPSLC